MKCPYIHFDTTKKAEMAEFKRLASFVPESVQKKCAGRIVAAYKP